MYGFEEMIEMGLNEGQEWPSDAHRQVAVNLCICNANVNNRTTLIEVCQAVISVPEGKIKTITFPELIQDFGLPNVGVEFYG